MSIEGERWTIDGAGLDMKYLKLDWTMQSYRKSMRGRKKYDAQYVYITIDGLPTRAMIDTGEEANIITKTTKKTTIE